MKKFNKSLFKKHYYITLRDGEYERFIELISKSALKHEEFRKRKCKDGVIVYSMAKNFRGIKYKDWKSATGKIRASRQKCIV